MIFYSWTWIPVLIIFSIVILFCLEDSRESWATFWFVVGTALINYIFQWHAVYWVRDNLGHFALLVLAYFVIGVVWSVMKWYFFLLNIRDEVREAGTAEAWKRGVSESWKSRRAFAFKIPPDPAEHKDRIVGWMTYWPLSAIWTLINDPIKRLWKIIYARLAGVFKGISDRVFHGVWYD